MCITESLCCTPEMNTTLKINYTSLKRFLMCVGPSSGSIPHAPRRPPAPSTPCASCLWTRRPQRAWKTSTTGGGAPAHTHPALRQWGVRRLRRGPLPAGGSCQHDTEKATGSKVKVQKEKKTLLNSGMFILPLKKATRRSS